jgi:hypothetical protein
LNSAPSAASGPVDGVNVAANGAKRFAPMTIVAGLLTSTSHHCSTVLFFLGMTAQLSKLGLLQIPLAHRDPSRVSEFP